MIEIFDIIKEMMFATAFYLGKIDIDTEKAYERLLKGLPCSENDEHLLVSIATK